MTRISYPLNPQLNLHLPIIFKIFLFGLAILSSLGIYGCSPSKPDLQNQPVILKVWHAYRGEERQQLELDLKSFTQETGIDVRALPLPYNAFANKVLHYLRDDILRYNDATVLFCEELPLSVLKKNLSQGRPVLSASFFL